MGLGKPAQHLVELAFDAIKLALGRRLRRPRYPFHRPRAVPRHRRDLHPPAPAGRRGHVHGIDGCADDRGDNGRRHRLVALVARLFVLALDAEDVRFTPAGVDLHLRTRIDEAVPSRTVTLTRSAAAATCPVRALEKWLRSSATAFGPVFRKVDRWGNVEHGRLGPHAGHRILARRTNATHRTPSKKRGR